MVATPSTTVTSSTNQNANTGAAIVGSNSNNNNNSNAATTTTTGNGLNVGAVVGIAIGVGIIALAFVLLAFILCARTRRKKKNQNEQNQNQNQTTEMDRVTEASESERGTDILPRGGTKTFTDVVEAGRYDARSLSRSSMRSNPFADRPEMTAIGNGRNYRRSSKRGYDRDSYGSSSYDRRSYDRRSDDRRSYSRGYDRSYDGVYDQAVSRTQRDTDRRSNEMRRPTSVSTTRTSRSFYPEEEDRRYYSSARDNPPRDDGRARSKPGRKSRNYAELDVPEPAATYLRDPFATPEPRVARRRSTSPKRYLYPEVTDRDINDDDDDEEEEKERAESRADTDRSQPKPVNYLPVFAKPVYAILPGSSGAVVEMI